MIGEIKMDTNMHGMRRRDNTERTQYYGIPISLVTRLCEQVLEEISPYEDNFRSRERLVTIINNLCTNEEYCGDEKDIHNLATTLARKDEYRMAYDVLEYGLKRAPQNVDLLADLLQNGMKCGKNEEIKKAYEILDQIPRERYTARGFTFSIRYIQYLIAQSNDLEDIENYKGKAHNTVEQFKEAFPYLEDPYSEEAEMYKMLNQLENEKNVLLQAMEKIAVCPKCAVKYGDMMFDMGIFDEARIGIERAKKDVIQTQSCVSEGYIYYLSALCTIRKINSEDRNYREDEVDSIYGDFDRALKEYRNENVYVGVIRDKVETIINQTDIEIDKDRYEELESIIN